MTQEDKKLLFKDLCARLPYGVKVKTPYNDAILRGIVDRKGVKTIIDYTDIVTDKQTYPIRYIQPYLRPMSSMTDEECKELGELPATINNISETFPNTPYYIEVARVEQINWLLEHHFDFMGLISKGLAIEVTENNNPYKE